jgi:hypothetical protein
LCIEQYQNSGTQGPILADLVQYCNLRRGDKVLYRVEGGCPSTIVKREEDHVEESPALYPRADSTTITLSGANATLRDPNGDGSLTYVAIDLGTLQDGNYNIGVNLDGTVDNVTVLDSDGNKYAKCETTIPSPRSTKYLG